MTGTEDVRYLYWRFVALGVATLAAWNAYIVSADFFRWVLRDTPLTDSFESLFSVTSNSVNLAALCYALYTQAGANHSRRICNGLAATAAAFGVMALVAAVGVEGWMALVAALLALCAAAVASAYIQCSVYGIAAPLPTPCAEGYMGGQAIAGTIASAAQLAVVYSGPDRAGAAPTAVSGHLQLRTAAYFGALAVFLALCAGVWRQMHARLALRNTRDGGWTADHAGAVANAGPAQRSPSLNELDVVAPESGYAVPPAADGAVLRRAKWLESLLGLQNALPIYVTCAEIAPFILVSGVVMGQTLAVFPPLTEAVVSSPRSSPRVSHLTAWHFLMFNVGDYAGRLCTRWLGCRSLRTLRWASHARWLLVPALLLFPTAATPLQRSLLVHSDLLFLTAVLALGWTNGWAATTALILGPQYATSKELAGSILGVAMCVGLVIGAVASYPILLIAGTS
ncbi:hypothetical protein LPJ61_000068 [Coemansia biformis]|uniref:Nucleoside transporter n=1 Tax=Coemansia biformis TaxID=1286918 RepID=A0A9W7YJK9_9FUNG|nr:hypothetical protein LPJ61_000068 [Coemansia biformis]